jgi:Ni/Co efflux regulator RcnB
MKRVMSSALVMTLLASGAAFAQDGPAMERRGQFRQDRPDMQQAYGQQRQDRGDAQRAERPQRPDGGQRQNWDERQKWSQDRGERPNRQRPAEAQPQQVQPQQVRPQQDWRRGERPDRAQRPDQVQAPQRGDGQRPNAGQWRSDRGDQNRSQWNGQRNDGRNWSSDRNDNRGQWSWQRPGAQQFRDRDRGRQQFDQRRYQPVYRFNQRYRLPAWRPPIGFYAHTWVYGDILPRAWYGTSYYLDWFRYGLPMPPIGAEWVRSGDDAILVDTWTGRVLSVAYDLFW